jgi:hypothetical protein
MSLSPQKVDFEKVWGTLSSGVGNILTLTGVRGMPMVEYPSNFGLIMCSGEWGRDFRLL